MPTFKTVLCKYFELGHCSRGEDCTYAHGLEDLQTREACFSFLLLSTALIYPRDPKGVKAATFNLLQRKVHKRPTAVFCFSKRRFTNASEAHFCCGSAMKHFLEGFQADWESFNKNHTDKRFPSDRPVFRPACCVHW